jgi:hypothetical protein
MNEQTRSVAIIIILGMCTFALYLITGPDWSDNEPVLYAENEQSPWLEAQVHNQIVYFLRESPHQIDRFDLTSESWLSPIALQETPTAFAVDSDGLYVAEGDDINHYELNGANPTNMLNDPGVSVRFIVTADEYIYFHFVNGFARRIRSIDKATAVIIDSTATSRSFSSAAIAPTVDKLSVQNIDSSPRHIKQIVLHDNGTFGPLNLTPYLGLIRIGSELYTSPDETYLIDNSGAVYATGGLTITYSLAGPFIDIAFYNQQPVVLREGFVYLYDEHYREIGRQEVANSATNLFVHDDNLFVFLSSGQVVKIALADIPPAAPAPIVDPQATHFTAAALAWDEEDTLFILSREHQNIFRWSSSQRQYLTAIPLTDEAEYISFDSQNERLFVGYLSGRIATIDLDTLVEQTFANNIPPYAVNTHPTTCNISFIDDHILICSRVAWTTYQVDGLVNHRYMVFPRSIMLAEHYAWYDAYRRFYFTRYAYGNTYLSWVEVDTSGNYSWPPTNLQFNGVLFNAPMQVDQPQNTLLLGSGHIIDLETPAVTGMLADTFDHATLLNGFLVSQKTISSDGSQVTRWNADYQIMATSAVPGTSLQLLTTPDNQILSVTEWLGRPFFTIWDENLNIVYQDSYETVHLPLTFNNYCSDFYDDFSNPNRGWFVGENPIVKTAYIDDEYQVLNKVGGYINLLFAPSCPVPNYAVSVDARWVGTPGNSYGLLFGLTEDGAEFYIADVNTDLQMYRVMRYRNGQLQTIVGPHESIHIQPGTAVNNLRVFVGMPSQTPRLFINDVDHGFIYEPIGSGTRVGLVASGYQGQNNADARFDNFVFRRSASAFETASTPDIVLEPEELLTESWSIELGEPIWLSPDTGSISIPVLPAWPTTDSD